MPPLPDLRAASGWRRTFDGTALPAGGIPFVPERCPEEAGAILVLAGAESAWVPALLGAGRRLAVLDASRPALARLAAAFPGGPGGDPAPRLVHGDPREFEIVPGAGSVLVPAPLLASLGTGDERRAVLGGARAQLGEGGRVVVHHEPLPADLLPPGAGGARLVATATFPHPGGGGAWTRATTVAREPATGRTLLRHAFRPASPGPGGERGLLLGILDREEILADLEEAGLEAREVLGGFDAHPCAPGGAVIVVAAPRPG